jgi:glycyl-tRNA synthetase beta chain
MAARKSSRATARWCGRGFPMRCISGRPTRQPARPDRLKASAKKFGLDLAKPLDQRMAKLDHLGVTFHAKLGTQGERVARIAAGRSWRRRSARRDARRAAVLAKADLTTEIVGEFPEVQGAMGRIYAEMQGEDVPVSR